MFANASLIRSVRQFWAASDLAMIEQRRERRVLLTGSLLVLMIGLGWGFFFAWHSQWEIFALDVVLVLAAAALNWWGQVRGTAIALFLVLIGVVSLIALAFDVPTALVPRSTHLHLVPLSAGALLAFRNEAVWLRHGVALCCLLAFVLLAADPGWIESDYTLSENVRQVGAWVHASTALLSLYVLLYIMQSDAIGRTKIEADLRLALERCQFELHYQPQVDTKGQVVGAEALLRWHHPQRGMLLPEQFIALAEHTGLMLPIGQWVLETACAQLRVWANYSMTSHLSLAVNISQTQFRQSDFVGQVLALIERNNIDANLLELELTETMLVEDVQGIIDKMSALRARGVKFSLDDFGTGFSSLNYLKRLPLNTLKIDQSFVRDVLIDPHDAAIASTVVALGKSLGLSVVAEGVETEGQRQFLLSHGCQLFQGFLYSRALPIAGFNSFVLQHNPSSLVR